MTALSDGMNPVGPPGNKSPQILLAFLPEIESLIPVTSRPRLVIGESVGQQETNPARQSAGDG
jgi:hypothetical protein